MQIQMKPMKTLPEERHIPRVALLVESSRSYGRELLMGIARYLRIHGHWSVEFEESEPWVKVPEWFDRWKWDGVIARVQTPAIARAVGALGVPVVDLSGCLPDSPFPTIRSDETTVGRMAAEHLLGRGFQRFAFCGLNGFDWSDRRRAAFEERVAAAGFHCEMFDATTRRNSTRDHDEHGKRFEQDLKRWLESLPEQTGLMACNDSRGRQVLNCCRELGVAVPDALAVIGVDKDEVLCELSSLPLSSVILNAQQIGYEAAALLDRLMAGESAPETPVLVKPIGVAERHSTDVLAIADRQIAAALKYIREHACDGVDVDSLLRAVPLSRSVLERRFSQILGSSPKTEILRVRLGRVCQLLAESDLSLAQVAEKVGFDHPEYMSRLFRKKMGVTPGEFRKQAGPGRLPLL
jgi:LacI family transcriptional regulator